VRSDLVFSASPFSGKSTDLVFGETDAPALLPAEFTLLGPLPGLGANLRTVPVVSLGFAAQLPMILGAAFRILPSIYGRLQAKLPGIVVKNSGQAELLYVSRTERPVVNQLKGHEQLALPIEIGLAHLEQHALVTDTGVAAWFSQARNACSTSDFRYKDAERTLGVQCGRFQESEPVDSVAAKVSWQEGAVDGRERRTVPFHEALQCSANHAVVRFQDGLRDKRNVLKAWWNDAQSRRHGGMHTAGFGRAVPRYWQGPFQDAWVPRTGIESEIVDPGINPSPCYVPDGALLFAESRLGNPHLLFVCERQGKPPIETVVVPIRRIYMVVNNASLHRVDGNIELPTLSMTLGLDVDSWTWSFSAALPGRALANLEPAGNGSPVEVEAVINGRVFRALVESLERTREFGTNDLRISGRGKTALLDAPYAPIQSFTNTQARTAQQIMGDVLTINGVPLGWSVDWGLADWSIPAGVFNHQGTYIGALNKIASAAGGYVQPHASAQTLKVLPRYPTVPWEWGSVVGDFQLPVDATSRESLRWLEKPAYNRVFVSGQEVGVLYAGGQVILR